MPKEKISYQDQDLQDSPLSQPSAQTQSQQLASAQQSSKKPKKKRWFGKALNIILIVVIVVLAWGYYSKEKQLKLITDPNAQAQLAQQQVNDVVAQVGKIALLPNETPQVLTISDAAAAIQQQPNLAGVTNGDEILLYVKAGKAIIYSPSRNIIVNILPIILQDQNQKQPLSGTGVSAATQATTTATAQSAKKPGATTK